MTQNRMTCQHLCNADGATPANVVRVANFYLAKLGLMKVIQAEESFKLLKITLQQWGKVLTVAEIKQAIKSALKAIPNLFQPVVNRPCHRALGHVKACVQKSDW